MRHVDALAQEASICVVVEGEPGIREDAAARRAAEPRRGARLPRPLRLGDGVRADLPFSVWADALDAYVVSQELGLQLLGR